jgi:hypothetical protein
LESESAGKPAVFQPKQSRANKLWLCIIVVVLTVLFFEMHGNSTRKFNCCISTNSECVGADVLIDHQKVGTIAREEKGGLGGGAYRLMLGPGHHLLEIKKELFKPFSQEIDMHKEKYIEANVSKLAG